MLNLSRVIKPWKEAGALSAHINLYGFWTETTFLTKSGDLGMVLSVTGVDYESLDNDEQQYAVKRLESALKSFGEGFHVYQYLFKTNRPEIPFASYDDALIDAAIDQRRQFFESKRDRLYQIELFYVIVLEGARSKTGIMPALLRIPRDPQGGIRELKAQFTNDSMKILLRTQIDADLIKLEQRVHNFTRQLKYTTLIVVPATEKIMEAATGDKDFWIVDVVGNFCFVHPAKPGISSNLNLITDKGNIYSFTLTDISATGGDPDLKVIIQPADASNIVAANGPAQYVPAAQLEQAHQQISTLESHVGATVDEYKSAYPLALKFDYTFKSNEAPFDIQSIYHDDKFTYIKTNAPEKFSVYEMRDGKPNLINYDLREGTYIIPKVMDSGYVELGKKKMEFTRKG
jgi:type IV secretory pathway VirB9-like protein